MKNAKALAMLPYVLIAGCAASTSSPTLNEVMDSWMGHHVSEVIRAWGPADRLAEDGAGGKIYIWITPGISPSPPRRVWVTEWNPVLGQWEGRWKEESTGISGAIRKSLERELARSRRKEFFVRPDGIIYWYRTGYEE